ncbi:hypothetical protein CU044_6857 [Streptomyces sp. L-9-10]|nr:hypothetical protein CU044_6857 [Streptomyces sp. L-9-10]
MPDPALRDAAVGKSLERLRAGGEIISVIGLVWWKVRGKQPAADALPDIRSRAALYRY